MKTTIFLHNVVPIKCDIQQLRQTENEKFILITSPSCYQVLSQKNRASFDSIYQLNNFSVDSVEQLIRQYSNDLNNVSLVTADEFSLLLAAQVRELLNIAGPSPEIIELFIDKPKMKNFLSKKICGSHIKLPEYCNFDKNLYSNNPNDYAAHLIDTLGNHIIAKPRNMAGAIEVSELTGIEAISEWCANHLEHPYEFEFNEFIDGKIYHCDSIVKDGKILLTYICENSFPCLDFLSGKFLSTLFLTNNNPLYYELSHHNQTILNHMPVPDGLTHLEFFRRPNGEVVFLEIAARPVGGDVVHCYEKMTGLNFQELHYKLNMHTSVEPKPLAITEYHGWGYYPKKSGLVTQLSRPMLDSEYKQQWHIKVGDVLDNSSSILDIAGKVYFYNDNYCEFKADFEKLKQHTPYQTRSVSTQLMFDIAS